MLPKNQHIEHTLLAGLKNGLPAKEVLQQLPRQTLSLYYHSVQSLVFNLALSARVTMVTDPMVSGDLVLAEGVTTSAAAEAGLAEEGEEDECAANTMGVKLPAVRTVQANDLPNTSLIERVVLPLPGCDVRYPEHLAQTYDSILAALGLSKEAFGQAHLRAITLTGHYRRVVLRPEKVEWEWFGGEGKRATPIVNDVERLLARGRTGASCADDQGEAQLDGQQHAGGPPESTEAGKLGVLKFGCRLPPSAYFTMALREVTRMPVERS
mmetsp:Transcript_67857/g.157498  ORF Transcript_67857/g.157498 Transcript_67857/m.157498 type:complete len:267 (+) Transcript_67857:165-965(+)